MINNIFRKQKGTGALEDLRPFTEKEKDYEFKEMVTSAEPVNWVEKNSWRTFPIYDQNGSGSCVAQTVAKMLGVMYWLLNNEYVHFSATHVYQRRDNKPKGGMEGVNALDIAREGVTLEDLVVSQKMTDEQMDSVKIPEYKAKVGEIFKVGNYVTLPTKDIDTIASVIQKTGKPVMVWFYFNHDEWTKEPTIKRYLEVYGSKTSRHSVTAVDFFLKNGKKYLVIDDSWGTSYGEKGQRFISEDFFKVRNFFAAYFINFKFDEVVIPDLPKITKDLQLGMNDPEVKILQDKLKVKGFFPTNIESTGYFGAITKKAVQQFQTSVGLLSDGVVRKQTRITINK